MTTATMFSIARLDLDAILVHDRDTGLTLLPATGTELPRARLIGARNRHVIVADGRVVCCVGTGRKSARHFFFDVMTKRFYFSHHNQIGRLSNFLATKERVRGWELFDLIEETDFGSFEQTVAELLEAPDDDLIKLTLDSGDGFPFTISRLLGLVDHKRLVKAIDDTARPGATPIDPGRFGSEMSSSSALYFDIVETNRTHPEKVTRRLGADLDGIATAPAASIRDDFLNNAMRATVAKREVACLVATARNEGVYLVEWIAYHLDLGFQNIFIYTNNNSDGSLALLEELDRTGLIRLIQNDVKDGVSPQDKAYNHALRINSEISSYSWCAFIDLDEFIYLNRTKFSTIKDYLSWFEVTDCNVIALHWIVCGNTERTDDWVTEPVTRRVRLTSPLQSHLIKCICRPEQMRSSGAHRPRQNHDVNLKVVAADRSPYRWVVDPNRTFDISKSDSIESGRDCFLYHYELRSLEEFL